MRSVISMPNKKVKLSLTLIAFILLLVCSNTNAQNQKPNIIFILGDDIGYSIPTINGGQSYSTPNIDSMARHGMNFTHCEGLPVCAPSRCMLLSGKYNFRNYSNWGYMNKNEQTFGNVMRDAGYATGFFGKLQLEFTYELMHNWGFDTYTIFSIGDDTLATRRYKNPTLVDNNGRIPDSATLNKYCDDILTDRIFDFIDSNKQKPFFVYYPMSLAHEPFSPTPDDAAFASWNTDHENSDTSFFPSMIKYMDKKIGVILDSLRAKGLDKNTIVLFCGDNGTPSDISFNANGKKHIMGEKGESTEGGTHVPLIAYWPDHIREGSYNDDLIDFTDFLPTFADAAIVSDLGNYGILDGTSFYPKLLEQHSSVHKQLFFHFDPHPGGFEPLERWVRDKKYKLYDSTGASTDGKFYNIIRDPKELSALNDSVLTQKELSIKERFRHILDTMPTWPAGPVVNNLSVSGITNKSVIIGADIVAEGASPLIERGSTIANSDHDAYLDFKRLADSTVSLGALSQLRSDLSPQTEYNCSVYAINNNAGNSTTFATGSFFTLSNPPSRQPKSFKVKIDTCFVSLSWGNAKFPTGSGASNAGYLLIYSSDSIALIQYPNGHAPADAVSNGHIIALNSTVLPELPPKSARVYGLSQDSIYQFLLVPYTWNGLSNNTYNYLTQGALTATARPVNTCDFNFINRSSDHSAQHSLNEFTITPNPSRLEFHLHISGDQLSKQVLITVYDVYGKQVYRTTGENMYDHNFGSTFIPGAYLVHVECGNITKIFKVVKQ